MLLKVWCVWIFPVSSLIRVVGPLTSPCWCLFSSYVLLLLLYSLIMNCLCVQCVNDRLTLSWMIDSRGQLAAPGAYCLGLSQLHLTALCFGVFSQVEDTPQHASLPLLYTSSLGLKGPGVLKSNFGPLPQTSLLTTFSREVSSTARAGAGPGKQRRGQTWPVTICVIELFIFIQFSHYIVFYQHVGCNKVSWYWYCII